MLNLHLGQALGRFGSIHSPIFTFCSGSHVYGKTKAGAYLTEADAKAKGAARITAENVPPNNGNGSIRLSLGGHRSAIVLIFATPVKEKALVCQILSN